MIPPRVVVGITGASGICLAQALLAALATVQPALEVHLIVSANAQQVLMHEGGRQDILALAHHVHDPSDFAAPMASGSWQHTGMVICPCSMASLAAIATGCGQNLIHRAADVTLKERRPLVLATRETPFSRIHLTNMLAATEAGATIMPPCPAYYADTYTLPDVSAHFAMRVLDQLGIVTQGGRRWQ